LNVHHSSSPQAGVIEIETPASPNRFQRLRPDRLLLEGIALDAAADLPFYNPLAMRGRARPLDLDD
jgi:hypothetical protein